MQEVNALATEIARLNQLARDGAVSGQVSNEVMDLRDRAVSKLAELIDIRTVPQDFDQVNVIAAGVPIILNSAAVPLSVDLDQNNNLYVHTANSQQAVQVSGGKLAGLLTLHNAALPEVQARFEEFANGLVSQIDHIHATGLSLNGPMTTLTSERLVTSPGLPLGLASLQYPPQKGDLYITVTDFATGERTLNRIAFDPATQNLASLAGSMAGIPHLNAVVDPAAGTLTMLAQPGFGFDFTGNLSSKPDAQAITGTVAASIGGQYVGLLNDTLNFTFSGAGTIGVTPNLALEVRNGAGTLLASLNVGLGYEGGTALASVLGVNVTLGTGTVNAGDSFQVNVAADADSARLLPALGLNTFFIGGGSTGLRVRPDLLDHPERLAGSTSGQPGDPANLTRILAQRDQRVLVNGSQTFGQFLGNLIGDVGSQVQDAQVRQTAYDSLGTRLSDQQQSVSGVDPNEELLRVIQYQRAYQMSARFVTAVNETLDELLRLV
jgi:flagellar hook-associated protein 1 FlgK